MEGPVPIEPAPGLRRAEGLPLPASYGRILEARRAAGGGPGWRMLTIHSRPGLNQAALRQAWEDCLSGHEAFWLKDQDRGEPPDAMSGLPPIEESVLGDPSGLGACLDRMRAGDPFGPAWHLSLLRCDDGAVISALSASPLCCDERSLALLVEEVSALYLSADRENTAPSKPWPVRCEVPDAPPPHVGDGYAWERPLAGQPPEALLLGRTRREGESGRDLLRFPAGPDIRAAIVGLAGLATRLSTEALAHEEAERCAILAIAFALACRLGGQRDLVVAEAVDGRGKETKGSIGPMDDVARVRLELARDETARSLLARILAARPFARSHARDIPVPAEPASVFIAPSIVWPSSFCGLPAGVELHDAGALAWESGSADGRRTGIGIRYPDVSGQGGFVLDFDSSLYPPDTQARIARYFRTLLAAMAREPDRGIEELEILDSRDHEEQRALGRGREPAPAPDILEALARRVAEGPARIAAEFSGESINYAELDGVTNRMARRLLRLGVVRGSRVAVAMPRGFGELCALVAVLKADGAYVPIDSLHPAERIRIVLEEAEPQVLIAPADSPLRSSLPRNIPVLALDDPRRECLDEDSGPLPPSCEPSQLAYILFTSGSTGRPKGVEIPRAALANFLQSFAHEPGLAPPDRVLAITTTTFDIAGLELFLPLYAGATTVIADRETARDPSRLRLFVEQSGITLMQATPATWRLLLEAGWSGHPGLRMLCGGEAMSLALARRLMTGGGELWNVYGPTETTVWSTLALIQPGVEKISIGHPLDHTTVSIRGNSGAIVPLGCVGEICIGGKGLALGYHGRPDLTAERFPVDPATGERYYRTGDLGRFLPEGSIECLGRMDNQIKVRGFRIEPSDIEAQIRTVPGVSEALVLGLPRSEGDPVLAAYWTGSATREAVHECVLSRLPRYMVPSAYVHLEAFPTTTSGKIDRKALPAPEAVTQEEAGGLAPRTDKESVVAAIWREVLRLPFVPVDQDFFILGGTSIRAVLMRARIQDAFGVELPLGSLFDHPTVEGLVASLDRPGGEDAPVILQLSAGIEREPWIGLLGIQLYEDLARAMEGRFPFLAMHVPVKHVLGAEDIPSIPELAGKYVESIRRRQAKGPYYLVGLCYGGLIAFEAAAQLEEAGEVVGLVVLLDADLPMARRTRPFVRLAYGIRKLIMDPSGEVDKIVRRLDRISGGSRRNRATEEASTGDAMGNPVDMPFDGPEIDEEMKRYQESGRKLKCEVLAFRATRRDVVAPWVHVSPDLGWTGRASRVHSFDIASSHLGIVRSVHAAEVARVMMEVRNGIETRSCGKG